MGGQHRLLIVPPPGLCPLARQEGLGKARDQLQKKAEASGALKRPSHCQSTLLQRTSSGQSSFSSAPYSRRGSEFGDPDGEPRVHCVSLLKSKSVSLCIRSWKQVELMRKSQEIMRAKKKGNQNDKATVLMANMD